MKKCTCSAPPDAGHSPGCPLATIWTPPEKLDANVQRMAWLMFIEWWKVWIKTKGELSTEAIHVAYENSLTAAKIVRGCEVEAGSA